MANNPHQSLKDEVLKKINLDELKMRPRLYFSVKLALVVLVAILIALVSAFIFNFILFHLSASGRSLLLSFGPRGYYSFIKFFPWWLLLLDLALIFALVWLLRQFTFGYQRPTLYLLLALVGVIFGVGIFLNFGTDLNDRLERPESHGHPLHGFEGVFEGARRPPPPPEGICRCTITAINGNTITAEDYYFGATSTRTIILPSDSPDATSTGLEVGDTIFVVGDAENEVIQAFGIQKID